MKMDKSGWNTAVLSSGHHVTGFEFRPGTHVDIRPPSRTCKRASTSYSKVVKERKDEKRKSRVKERSVGKRKREERDGREKGGEKESTDRPTDTT